MTMRRPNFRFLLMVAVPLAVVGVGMYALHGSQVERSAGVLLQQADLAEEDGNPGEALDYLDRYIGLRPDDADAAARASLLRAEQAEDGAAALQAFLALERALRLAPDREDLRRKAVEVAMRQELGRYADAMAHLEDLLDKAPEDPELRFLMARALEGDKNYREAERAYRQALELDPHRVQTYVRLASLEREQLEDPEAADRVMGVASDDEGIVKNNPESARAYLERGLYRTEHRLTGADADFARAMDLAPDDPDILIAAAVSAFGRGEVEESRKFLERAKEQAPDNPRVFQGLARIEAAAGNFEVGAAILEKGIEAVADGDAALRIELLGSLAELMVEGGRFKQAHDAITRIREVDEKAREIDIRPGWLDFLKGKVKAGEGRWVEAIGLLKNARTFLTNQPEMTYQIDLLLGRCYEQVGNPDLRLAAYRNAVTADPVAVPGRLGLAAAQAALGRFEEAVATYRPLVDEVPGLRTEIARLLLTRAFTQPEDERAWAEVERALADAEAEQPGSAELARLRARALLARDRGAEARDVLTRATQQHPEDAVLRATLASLIGLGGEREQALAELEDLERRQGDTAATRLARAGYWVSQGGEEALAALTKLEEGLDEFGDDDRRRVLNGLIVARRQLGDLSGADQLLDTLSELMPDDLAPRIFGIQLTLAAGTDAAKVEAAREIDAILKDQPPEDLPTLARLFDLSLAANAEPQADRVLERLRPAEGVEGPVWRQAEARTLYLKAVRLEQVNGRQALLARARTLLNEAALRRPGWAPVPLTLSFVEELDGDEGAAIRALELAREQGVRDRDSLLRLYRLYLGQGRTEQADALVAEMRTLGLGDDDRLIAKLAAESSLREADPTRALEQARDATPADSGDYRDHLWLAQFLTAAEQAEEAEAELRKAVELAKDEPAPRIALVRFLAAADRKDEALQAIELARAELPEDQTALALARCFAAVGDAEQPFQQFDRAIAASPRDPAPLRAAAETALLGNQIGQAEDYLARLARLGPDAPDDATWARRTLALLMAVSGDPTKRREAVSRLGTGEAGTGAAAIDELRTRAQVLALQVDRQSRQQAIRLLEQIIDQKTAGTPDDRFLLAQLYEANGDWSRAKQRMIGLLAENGDSAAYFVRYIGWLLVPEPGRGHEPEPEAARPWIDRLEKLAPDSIQAAEARARYLVASGKRGEAVARLERHAEAHPDQLAIVAPVVEQLDSPARAEPLYRRLVERSDDPAALLRLAGVLERTGDARQAETEEAYRRYVDESENPTAVFPLAGYLARQGRLDDALALCEQARLTCPPDAVANATLELVFNRGANSDQFERAARLLGAIRAEHPDDVVTLFQLANLRSLQGRDDEAERLFRDSVAKAPGQPGPLNNLAWFLAMKDEAKADEALELINQAIANVGEDPNLLDTRSLVFLRLDRVDDALADLITAISRSRQPDPLYYLHRAQARLQAGDRAEAAEDLDNARKAGLAPSSIPPLERSGYDRLVAKLGGGN